MESAVPLVAAGALALILSAGITPLVIHIAHRRGWYDIPNARKIHTSPIPRLGGVGIFLGLIIASLAVPLLSPLFLSGISPIRYGLGYLPLFVAFAIIHGTGLVDDFHNLNASLKFLLQILAAFLVTVGGFTISRIAVPGWGTIDLGIFAYPITMLWIVAISNALNFVDGVDGLAGGIAAIAALTLAIMGILAAQPATSLLALSLLGAVAGFLVFNLPPARIFMGDSGSLFMGFVLAVIPLTAAPGRTAVEDMFAPATLVLIPILDTVTSILRRIREKRAIYSPDKEHIHHKLLAVGLRETGLLVLVYGLCFTCGAAVIASQYLSGGSGAALLAGVWGLALIGFGVLTSVRQRRKAIRTGLDEPR